VASARLGVFLALAALGCGEEECEWRVWHATPVPDAEYVEPLGTFEEVTVNGGSSGPVFPHGAFEPGGADGMAGAGGGAPASGERGPGVIPSGRLLVSQGDETVVRSYLDVGGRSVEETWRIEPPEATSFEPEGCEPPTPWPEESRLVLVELRVDGEADSDWSAYDGYRGVLSGELERGQMADDGRGTYGEVWFTAYQWTMDRYDEVYWREVYVP